MGVLYWFWLDICEQVTQTGQESQVLGSVQEGFQSSPWHRPPFVIVASPDLEGWLLSASRVLKWDEFLVMTLSLCLAVTMVPLTAMTLYGRELYAGHSFTSFFWWHRTMSPTFIVRGAAWNLLSASCFILFFARASACRIAESIWDWKGRGDPGSLILSGLPNSTSAGASWAVRSGPVIAEEHIQSLFPGAAYNMCSMYCLFKCTNKMFCLCISLRPERSDLSMFETQVCCKISKFWALKGWAIVCLDLKWNPQCRVYLVKFRDVADVDCRISTSGYLEYSSMTTKR